ncbi:hypothetical protein [Streptomyces sp. SID10815]|uniref:hypothetical protein n=1 Tax=Streptomyces sp. SID10815 TaxID=2706027 RepID=UPI0013CD0D6C|nr:hypothetical protein [Streptomyces sp. SID10815]NEA46206.1 hypothetical protein [Streptomyces sp. SID10815]
MICDRCAEPIEGEPEVIPVDSASGAAPDVYLCPTLCRPSTAFPWGGGEGGDGLAGEPWPGPQEPPSPDGGPRFLG